MFDAELEAIRDKLRKSKTLEKTLADTVKQQEEAKDPPEDRFVMPYSSMPARITARWKTEKLNNR